MQSLTTTWNLKAGLWTVTQLGSDQCSFLNQSCRSRSRNLGFHSSNSRAIGHGNGFLSGFCKLQKSSLGALALDQDEIGSEVRIHDLNSDCGLLENSKSDTHLQLGNLESREVRKDGLKDGDENRKSDRINVRELAFSLRLAKTVDDVDAVMKEKGDLPLQVFSTVIRGLGKDKLLSPAFAVVEWMKRKKEETGGDSIGPNLFIYNSLLGAVKQSAEFEKMDKVLADMAQDSVRPNVVTYNAVMAIYIEQGDCKRALSVLDEMRNKGFLPSPVSYSTAMLAYRKMEDGFGAVKFFIEAREKYRRGEIGNEDGDDWKTEMVKLENFTTRICYQVMRQWLVNKNDLSTDVLKILIAMDVAEVPLGRSEHERLLWACTREEHALVAKELYDRIRERDSEMNLSVCNHVIWLMGKAKKWWKALEIYEDLLDKGPKPNNMSHEIIVSHFNVLLTAARKRGIWKWGVRLLDKMEAKGLKPGSKEWNAVLVACSKASETATAVKIFTRMVEQGQKPTALSYGALLSALEKGKLYDEARNVWEHMLKVGIKPNVYAYTIMASVFAGQGKLNLLDVILKDMVSSGVEPTVVTYNAIISGCIRNDMNGAAFEWFHRLKTLNVTPNNVTYEMLIEALAKDGKPRLAYEFYLRAWNEGHELTAKAYDIVVESSQMYGATIDVRLLGPRPPDRKGRSAEIEY